MKTMEKEDNKDTLKKAAKDERITRRLHSSKLCIKGITVKTKKTIYKTIFEGTVTFGAETSVRIKDIDIKSEVAETKFWQRSCSLIRAAG